MRPFSASRLNFGGLSQLWAWHAGQAHGLSDLRARHSCPQCRQRRTVSDTRGGAGVRHFRALHDGHAPGTVPANVCHVQPQRAQTWRTASARRRVRPICGGVALPASRGVEVIYLRNALLYACGVHRGRLYHVGGRMTSPLVRCAGHAVRDLIERNRARRSKLAPKVCKGKLGFC